MLVRLLGPPRIEGPHGAVTGPASHRHRLALIALLSQARRYVFAREKLIGLLWPETDASNARQLLSVSVYELRKVLGEDVLLSEGSTLRLDPQRIEIDVVLFENAWSEGNTERAAGLFTGPFLEGLGLPDATEFEHWAESERHRLEYRYQGVIEQLAEQAAVRRDHIRAVNWWRERVARTPEDGRVVRRLMEALENAGDRAGALQEAEQHGNLIQREFGADPDNEVVRLADRLRRGVTAGPSAHAFRLDSETTATSSQPRTPPASIVDPDRRLAVLPFAAIPSGLESEALALGLTDELIANLSRLDGVGVICRSSVMQYRGNPSRVAQIGEELRVDSVIEGAVYMVGDRIRVNVRLVGTESEVLLWSNSYERGRDEIMAMQREIALHVASALDPTQSGLTFEPPSVDPDAYRDYLLGRYHFAAAEADQLKAAFYVERAIARDPAFANAHATLSFMHVMRGVWGVVPPSAAFPGAKAAAERALALDPFNAEANSTLAGVLFWHEWDLTAADRQFQVARRRRGSAFFDTYMPFCLAMNRPDDAIAEAQRALALDPLSPYLGWLLAMSYNMQGRFQDALTHWQNTLEIRPDFPMALVCAASTYALLGRLNEAADYATRAEPLIPLDAMLLGILGFSYAMAGHTADALRTLKQLQEFESNRYVDPIWASFVYAGFGDVDQTMQCLERAIGNRSPGMMLLGANARTVYTRVRSDRRYAGMLKRMGLKTPSDT